jgi:hypothetical protein
MPSAGDFRTTGSGSAAVWAITQAGQSWSVSTGADWDFWAMSWAISEPTAELAPCMSSAGMAQSTIDRSPGREDAAAIAPGIKAWEISAITASARAMCLAAYPHMLGSLSGLGDG